MWCADSLCRRRNLCCRYLQRLKIVRRKRTPGRVSQHLQPLSQVTVGQNFTSPLLTCTTYRSMLIAREATARIVTSEIMHSNIINSLARKVRGGASVGLNAVAVQNARNR
jgi:hypothetical protein